MERAMMTAPTMADHRPIAALRRSAGSVLGISSTILAICAASLFAIASLASGARSRIRPTSAAVGQPSSGWSRCGPDRLRSVHASISPLRELIPSAGSIVHAIGRLSIGSVRKIHRG